MKRTVVREVPSPPSPGPAPCRLRGWLAHVVRTSIRRSKAESIEKTPTKIPAGGSASRFSGGKEDHEGLSVREAMSREVAGAVRDGGCDDDDGKVQ